MLALLLGGCAAEEHPPQPVPVVAEQRLCPPFPLPPQALIRPPARTDFLSPND